MYYLYLNSIDLFNASAHIKTVVYVHLYTQRNSFDPSNGIQLIENLCIKLKYNFIFFVVCIWHFHIFVFMIQTLNKNKSCLSNMKNDNWDTQIVRCLLRLYDMQYLILNLKWKMLWTGNSNVLNENILFSSKYTECIHYFMYDFE